MNKAGFAWSVFLSLLAGVILTLVFVGCNRAGEPPTGEHPEHPKAEGTQAEHPETPQAEEKKHEHPEHPTAGGEQSEHPEHPTAEPEE